MAAKYGSSDSAWSIYYDFLMHSALKNKGKRKPARPETQRERAKVAIFALTLVPFSLVFECRMHQKVMKLRAYSKSTTLNPMNHVSQPSEDSEDKFKNGSIFRAAISIFCIRKTSQRLP